MTRISGKTDYACVLSSLGDAIRAERQAAGMSQEALADLAGIDRSHLGRLERGERNITLLNLMKVARALDRPASELLAAANL